MQDFIYNLLESMIPQKLPFTLILEGPFLGQGVKNFTLKQNPKSSAIQQQV